jgi:hypothetical protein
MSETWKIRINGYGTFEFIGTETEAEAARARKARHEGASGIKWRSTNQTDEDRIIAQIADLWDRGEGAPATLMRKLRLARAALAKATTASSRKSAIRPTQLDPMETARDHAERTA